MIVLAALSAALAAFLWPARGHRARARLRGLVVKDHSPSQISPKRATVLRRGAAVSAGLACALICGGALGVVVGIIVAVGCDRMTSRLEPAADRERRARLAADLPIAVDLLSACLRGGTSWSVAVESVSEALGGPLGSELEAVAARVRLGADPADAWQALADEPALASLARMVARAADSGASLAPALRRLAQDHRRAARSAALARARAAGVRAVAPLGLCFLPAFVLLGIVPAIVGIAKTLQLP